MCCLCLLYHHWLWARNSHYVNAQRHTGKRNVKIIQTEGSPKIFEKHKFCNSAFGFDDRVALLLLLLLLVKKKA